MNILSHFFSVVTSYSAFACQNHIMFLIIVSYGLCYFSLLEQKCLSLWCDEDIQTERETGDQSVRH